MNCKEIQNLLSEFIDGELDGSNMSAIKAHMIRCPSCRSERDKLEQIGSGLRSLPPVTAPADFEFRIYAGIRNQVSDVQSPRRISWKMVVSPIAAMIIGILISPVLFQTINNKTPVLVGDTQPAAAEFVNSSAYTSDEQGVNKYTIDSYYPSYPVPITVDTIPDTEDDSGLNRSGTTPENRSVQPQPRYVLDQVPMRVTYDRIIY